MSKPKHLSLRAHLAGGVALMALSAGAAFAQSANTSAATVNTADAETVTVTGTSIRGTAPVGANVISVDRAQIELLGAQSTQEILTTLPQITNFGQSGVGSSGNTTGGTGGGEGIQGPTIHNLGQAVASGTLVLVDGHRMPLSGPQRSVADPSYIPASAIERVEVLPDGDSAIYGSDAVAGVINFVTRTNYDGLQLAAQYGMASNYNTFDSSFLFGTTWKGGSLLVSYDYSDNSELKAGNRSFETTRQDLRLGVVSTSLFGLNAQGQSIPASAPAGTPAGEPYPSFGPNTNTFACSPATIATSNSGAAFAYPYTAGTSISVSQNNPALGICSSSSENALIPSVVRNNMMVKVRQQIGDSITVGVDLALGSMMQGSYASRGTVTATVYGPGSTPPGGAGQINPFYVAVPGSTTGTETVRFDADQLLGPGQALSKFSNVVPTATAYLDWDMGGDWTASLNGTYGVTMSNTRAYGQLCASCAYEALNGTPNTNGTPNSATNNGVIDIYSLGTVITANRTLNTGNALDVWNPVGSANHTSAAVIASLTDSASSSPTNQYLSDVNLKADGPLFEWAGGTVKVAAGGEWSLYGMNEYSTTTGSLGPAESGGERYLYALYSRSVYAFYAEFYIPLISESMNVPLVQSFVLNVAGRYDHYSDFGGTQNPKVSFDWTVIDGLKARGAYGTSFAAPQFGSLQNPVRGLDPQATVTGSGVTNGFVVPANYLGSTQAGYGVGLAGTFCQGGCTINTNAQPGIQIVGGNANLKPMTGLSYSFGLDADFGKYAEFLDGLTASATYYQAKIKGLIQATGFAQSSLTPSLQGLSFFAPPGGWSSSDPFVQGLIGSRLLQVSLPTRIYTIFDFRQYNFFNLETDGIDFTATYRVPTDNYGAFSFTVNGSDQMRFAFAPTFGGPYTDASNNKQATYRPMDLEGRASIGWQFAPFSAQVSWTYINPYWNIDNTFPYNFASADGKRPAGFQKIAATNNFDLNLTYDLPQDGWTSGTQARLLIQNIFDTNPPFFGSNYDSGVGNPIGRLVTFSLKKTF